MSLAKRLKTIYTSGDQFTVLTLINKLIEEVEKYEVDKIIEEPVYTHFVTLSCTIGIINVTLTTPYEQKLTVDDIRKLMLYNANAIPCSGACNVSGEGYWPAINLKLSGTTGNLVVRYIDTTTGTVVTDTHDLVINSITDNVINIKEVLQ